MSRNSSNANKAAKARQITAMHKNGEKGPAKTTPLHNKRWGYRSNPETLKRIAEMLKASLPQEDAKREKTSAKRILRGAGKASQTDAQAD